MVTKRSKKSTKTTARKRTIAKNAMSSVELSQLTPKLRWNPFALAYTFAILGALWVLVISIAGKMGFFQYKIQMMQQYHMAYSLTPLGIIGGMAYVAVCGLISGFLIAWVYNKFVQ